jgi:hypothetical protein
MFTPPQVPDFSDLLNDIEITKKTNLGYANVIYERLMEQILEFESDLNGDEEIAAYLSSFGTTFLIQVEKIGYCNPFFIIFYGCIVDTKQRVRLVQHTTQLNVLFTSIKLNPEEKREVRRINIINLR